MKVCCCTDCRLLRDDFERVDLAPAVSTFDEAVDAVDEVQQIPMWWLTLPTGGTWTISFDGETTDDIAYDADAAAVQAALESLPNCGSGNIAVSGTFASMSTITFTFQNDLGGTDVPLLTADYTNLTGQDNGGAGPPAFNEATKGAPAVPELVHWSIDGGAAVCSTNSGNLTWDVDGGPDGQTGMRYRFRARIPTGGILGAGFGQIEPGLVRIGQGDDWVEIDSLSTSAGAWHSYDMAWEPGRFTLSIDGEPVAAFIPIDIGIQSPPLDFVNAITAIECNGGEIAVDDVKLDGLGGPCGERFLCVWPVGCRTMPDAIVLTVSECDPDNVENCADLSAINRAWHLERDEEGESGCAEYRVGSGAGCAESAWVAIGSGQPARAEIYGADEDHRVASANTAPFGAQFHVARPGPLEMEVAASDGWPHGCTATLEVE